VRSALLRFAGRARLSRRARARLRWLRAPCRCRPSARLLAGLRLHSVGRGRHPPPLPRPVADAPSTVCLVASLTSFVRGGPGFAARGCLDRSRLSFASLSRPCARGPGVPRPALPLRAPGGLKKGAREKETRQKAGVYYPCACACACDPRAYNSIAPGRLRA